MKPRTRHGEALRRQIDRACEFWKRKKWALAHGYDYGLDDWEIMQAEIDYGIRCQNGSLPPSNLQRPGVRGPDRLETMAA